MTILYVCADRGIPLDGHKGASVHVRQTVEGLEHLGHEVIVLAARPGQWSDGGRVILGARAGEEPAGPSRALARELDALSQARELVALAEASGVSFDAVYERYSLWSLAGAALADAHGVPFVLEVNAPLVQEQSLHREVELDGVAAELERYLVRRADAVLCVSSQLASRATSLRGRDDGVVSFPNAVDTGRFSPGRSSDRQEARPTVVFVGSLKPWHGLAGLLRAFELVVERHPAAVLWIAGHGPERKRLEAMAAELAIGSAVRFLGALGHDRIPQLLRDADIAVAPYPDLPDFYFSPLKVGEYLACGLPVVAAAAGDLRGLLADGESALLVPPGDELALADAIGRLIDDEGLRRRLGQAGRRLAVERLSLESAMGRLDGLLRALTDSACRREDR